MYLSMYLSIIYIYIYVCVCQFIFSRPVLSTQVVGATGSTIVSYVLPGLAFYRLCQSRKRYLGLALLCMGLVIMPLALTLIFLKKK